MSKYYSQVVFGSREVVALRITEGEYGRPYNISWAEAGKYFDVINFEFSLRVSINFVDGLRVDTS